MSQDNSPIAQCPQCNAGIELEHPYTWCSACGEPLPENILVLLPSYEKLKYDSLAAEEKESLPASNQEAAPPPTKLPPRFGNKARLILLTAIAASVIGLLFINADPGLRPIGYLTLETMNTKSGEEKKITLERGEVFLVVAMTIPLHYFNPKNHDEYLRIKDDYERMRREREREQQRSVFGIVLSDPPMPPMPPPHQVRLYDPARFSVTFANGKTCQPHFIAGPNFITKWETTADEPIRFEERNSFIIFQSDFWDWCTTYLAKRFSAVRAFAIVCIIREDDFKLPLKVRFDDDELVEIPNTRLKPFTTVLDVNLSNK
jgi:hypothetical protein